MSEICGRPIAPGFCEYICTKPTGHEGEHNWIVGEAIAHAALMASPNSVPELSMQQLINAGLNAFGLQLFAESVAGKEDSKTFKPFAFIFRGIKVTLEPHGEVDTRHH